MKFAETIKKCAILVRIHPKFGILDVSLWLRLKKGFDGGQIVTFFFAFLTIVLQKMRLKPPKAPRIEQRFLAPCQALQPSRLHRI